VKPPDKQVVGGGILAYFFYYYLPVLVTPTLYEQATLRPSDRDCHVPEITAASVWPALRPRTRPAGQAGPSTAFSAIGLI